MSTGLIRILALLFGLALLTAAAGAAYAQAEQPDKAGTGPLPANPDSPNTIALPNGGTCTTCVGPAWAITNTNTGVVGYFNLINKNTDNPALWARTVSSSTAATALLAEVQPAAPSGSSSAAVQALNYTTTTLGYAVIGQHSGSGTAIYGTTLKAGGTGVYGYVPGSSGAGKGVYGRVASAAGYGGYFLNSAAGGAGVYGYSPATSGTGKGVYGLAASPGGYGGYFLNTATSGGTGVYASGTTYGVHATGGSIGVLVESANIGVWATSARSYGVIGLNTATSGGVGVQGQAISPTGYGGFFINTATSGSPKAVYGEAASPDGYGGYFINTATSGGTGVYARGGRFGLYGGGSTYGVYGNGSTYGVYGYGRTYGVYAEGTTGIYGKGSTYGVYGKGSSYGVYANGYTGVYAYSQNGTGVYASGGAWAGYFSGAVRITGACTGCAGGTARIDHPLDSSKYVEQADVLASERLGIANGNVRLDAKGEAFVTLPKWFDKLYADFRYTLAPVGASAPQLYIAQEIKNNQFSIAGGKPGMKVSWQVSGVRQDKYAKEYPLQVEGDKPGEVVPPTPPAPPEGMPQPPQPPAPPQPPQPGSTGEPAKP